MRIKIMRRTTTARGIYFNETIFMLGNAMDLLELRTPNTQLPEWPALMAGVYHHKLIKFGFKRYSFFPVYLFI